MPKGNPLHYSIYERGTDRPIYIYGTAVECAAALGITVETFRTYVMLKRKNNPRFPQWMDLYFDEFDDDDDMIGFDF